MKTIFLFCSYGFLQQHDTIFNALFLGIISGLFAILFYNFFQSCVLTYMFRNINGKYVEHDDKGVERNDSEIFVRYRFIRNFFLIGYSLEIEQKCEERGDWKSKFSISPSNPLYCTGFYKYKPPKTGWGIQNIILNLKENKIYVEVLAKYKKNIPPNVYWLRKVKKEKAPRKGLSL